MKTSEYKTITNQYLQFLQKLKHYIYSFAVESRNGCGQYYS